MDANADTECFGDGTGFMSDIKRARGRARDREIGEKARPTKPRINDAGERILQV